MDDFTLAAHMGNLLLEKDSVETIAWPSLLDPIEPDKWKTEIRSVVLIWLSKHCGHPIQKKMKLYY